VGPGYYDVPVVNDYSKPKGLAWSRSATQRTNFAGFGSTNNVVGPGKHFI